MLCGAGGGYDIMTCLPLYYEMKDEYNIILCNLSFTGKSNLDKLADDNHINRLIDGCYEVVCGNYAEDIDYFPEYKLANILNQSVYVMRNYETVKEICNFYDAVLRSYDEIEKIYLCDAGCDILFEGLETELGTPVEDWMHFKAIMLNTKIKNKFVCALGMNSDCGHGVIENELLARLNFLRENKIILSEEILDTSDKDDKNNKSRFYYDIVLKCTPKYSIVNSFILSALEGNYGQIIPKYVKSRMNKNNK